MESLADGAAAPNPNRRKPEHLRRVYGPDYDLLDNAGHLVAGIYRNGNGNKWRRVDRQVALSVESVERFVRSAGSGAECVGGILSLQCRGSQHHPHSQAQATPVSEGGWASCCAEFQIIRCIISSARRSVSSRRWLTLTVSRGTC